MEKKRPNREERMFGKLAESFLEIARAIRDLTQCPIRQHHTFGPIEIKLFECHPVPTVPRVRFAFGVGQPQNKEKDNSMPIAVKITNEQKINVTLTPVTDTGKPAKLDGVPSWEVISGNATVLPAEDGMSAYLVSADDPGDTQVMVKADADIGEGVEEISDIVTLNVVGATAKNLGLTVGTPEPK